MCLLNKVEILYHVVPTVALMTLFVFSTNSCQPETNKKCQMNESISDLYQNLMLGLCYALKSLGKGDFILSQGMNTSLVLNYE